MQYIRGEAYKPFKEKEAKFMELLTTGALRIYKEDPYISDLVASIRLLNRNTKIKAVFIDYIQVLKDKDTKVSQKERMQEICMQLMTLSVDLSLPFIVGAQLNRDTPSPIEMAVQNIADASNIEHSANIVMLMWNSNTEPLKESKYYVKPKSNSGKKDEKYELSDEAKRMARMGFNIGTSGSLYVKLAKNREGSRNIDTVLQFRGNTGKITQDSKFKPTGSTGANTGPTTAPEQQEAKRQTKIYF